MSDWTDYRFFKFVHKCIKSWRGQDPPYDAMEVEFVTYCLRRFMDEGLYLSVPKVWEIGVRPSYAGHHAQDIVPQSCHAGGNNATFKHQDFREAVPQTDGADAPKQGEIKGVLR